MPSVNPMTFGARFAARRPTAEEAAWFFNVPAEPAPSDTPDQAELAEADDRIQVGPLDV